MSSVDYPTLIRLQIINAPYYLTTNNSKVVQI